MLNGKFKSLLSPGEKVTAEQLETDRQILAFERSIEQFSRRRFMGSITGAVALVAGAGFVGTPKGFAQTTGATPSISDVLNFALNLEYLEANLYSIALSGSPIPATLSGTSSPTITNSPGKLTLDTYVTALTQALLQDEQNHIALLRQTIVSLGGTPISVPPINYGAKGTITTQAQFLATTRQFTALGNSAYAGSAQYLVSSPAILTVAAQILGAEGQHMGVTNFLCIQEGVTTAFSTNPAAYIDAQDQPPSPTQYFTVALPTNTSGALPTNSVGIPAGLRPARTPQEVLGVAYGVSTPSTVTPPAGVTSGGFLPSGAAGAVVST